MSRVAILSAATYCLCRLRWDQEKVLSVKDV